METEIKYVMYAAIGFVIICIAAYFLTRKKVTDASQESVVINTTLKKRFHYNKILLYIIGIYRLLELLYFFIKGNESEQEFYRQLAIQGVLAIPSMIIGFLAIISSIAGIFLSLSYMRREKDIAKRLLIVSISLLIVSLFWKYIINFLIALFT